MVRQSPGQIPHPQNHEIKRNGCFFKPLSSGLVCNTAISEQNIGFWIRHPVFLDPFPSHEIFHVPVYFAAALPPTQMHIYHYFFVFV